MRKCPETIELILVGGTSVPGEVPFSVYTRELVASQRLKIARLKSLHWNRYKMTLKNGSENRRWLTQASCISLKITAKVAARI